MLKNILVRKVMLEGKEKLVGKESCCFILKNRIMKKNVCEMSKSELKGLLTVD